MILLNEVNERYLRELVSPWADLSDADDVDERMVKMYADLFSELVAVRPTVFRQHF